MSDTTYIDSRGWEWEKPPDRETWVLARIGSVECYGKDLHIWVGYSWFGDGKWHVGTGGGPRLDVLYDTAVEAMEGALTPAVESAGWSLERVEKEVCRRQRVVEAVRR